MEQRGGQRCSPLLATGQLSDKAFPVPWKIQKVHEELGALGDLCRGHAEHVAEVVESLCDGELVVHCQLLGHVADARPGDARDGRARGPAEHRDRSGLQPLLADDALEEGRFSAPAWPEEAVDSTFGYGHVEPDQHGHLLAVALVRLVKGDDQRVVRGHGGFHVVVLHHGGRRNDLQMNTSI